MTVSLSIIAEILVILNILKSPNPESTLPIYPSIEKMDGTTESVATKSSGKPDCIYFLAIRIGLVISSPVDLSWNVVRKLIRISTQ